MAPEPAILLDVSRLISRLGQGPATGIDRVEAEWLARCTYSDPERFFSYRRTTHQNEPDYGRLISAIAL